MEKVGKLMLDEAFPQPPQTAWIKPDPKAVISISGRHDAKEKRGNDSGQGNRDT